MDYAGQTGTWACAEGNRQPGENQVVGREDLRPRDERGLAAQHILTPHSISCHMTDSAEPGPRGRTW